MQASRSSQFADRRKLVDGMQFADACDFQATHLCHNWRKSGAKRRYQRTEGRISFGSANPAMQMLLLLRAGQPAVCRLSGSRIVVRAGASTEPAAPPASPARPCARRSGRSDWRARRRRRHWRGSRAPRRRRARRARRIARRRAASASTPTSSSIEPQATGTCRRLIAVKSSSPCCWRAAFIAGSACGAKRLDDPVGVPDVGVHAVAGGDAHELLGGRRDRGPELRAGIGGEAFAHDDAHLVAQPLEPAELVEQVGAPEEQVGVGRELVAVGAELRQARVGAMLGEIARDDAGLQHAAERDRAAARRPGEPAGDRDSWRRAAARR